MRRCLRFPFGGDSLPPSPTSQPPAALPVGILHKNTREIMAIRRPSGSRAAAHLYIPVGPQPRASTTVNWERQKKSKLAHISDVVIVQHRARKECTHKSAIFAAAEQQIFVCK